MGVKFSQLIKLKLDIIKKDSPFDIELDLPHTENVRKFSIANRSEKPKTVYIYTDEGLIEGSPFTSYSAAHVYI